jgi:hypothetical protein
MRAGVPEKPEGYEAALPAGFKLPEGVEVTFDANDPALAEARKFAHANGLTGEQFKNLLGLKAQLDIAQAESLKGMMARQVEALGQNGANRITAVSDWLTAKLGPQAEHLFPSIATAAQVQAYESLMRLFSTSGISPLSRTGAEHPTNGIPDDAYAAMSPAERLNAARKANAASARH